MAVLISKKSCLRCSRFLTCKDPLKTTRNHSCDRFLRLKEIADLTELEHVETRPKKTTKQTDESELDSDIVDHEGVKIRKKRAGKSSVLTEAEVDALPEEVVGDDFIFQAMAKAYDPETNTIRDLKIDDSHMLLAKNYYDFCANLAGKNIKMPFARQLWLALLLFGEVCPRCTHPKAFVMENVPVDMDPHHLARKMVLLYNGRCRKCGASKLDLLKANETKDYSELVLVLGQRAGKSTLAATLVCYALHRMCKSPKLSSMADGIQDFTPLTGSFIALSTTKSIKLLWNPIRDMIVASQWFDDYFDLLRQCGRRYGRDLVQFTPTGTYLRIFPKSLDFYPEGPSKRTLRGATRVIAAIDELGHFPYDLHALDEDYEDERERANADEVHTVVGTSLATVRTEVMRLYKKNVFTFPQGMFLNLSSPASFKDKIMRLYADSKGSELTLGVKAATWEVSPMYTRDHPIIVDAYRRNYRRADRDFGANPPALTSSVFEKSAILAMFHLQRLHAIVYDNTAEKTRGRLVNVVDRSNYPPAVLSMDAGLTNNAFALTLMYQVGREVFVPTVLEIVPAKGTKIDFVAVYDQVIYPLIKFCNVKVVYADRWNSIHILQSIEEDFKGEVTAKQYSVKPRDFDAFIDFVSTGNLHLPALEIPIDRIEAVLDYKKELLSYPASHLLLQFLTVQLENGRLVKGSNNTDDLLRSLVLGVTRLFDPKLTEHLGKFRAAERAVRSDQAVVLVSSRGMSAMSGFALQGARPPAFESFASVNSFANAVDVSDIAFRDKPQLQ